MAARIKKGDRVIVISGDDRGKQGEVLEVRPKLNRAVVQGINLAKHHTKPKGMGQPGGIVEREATIHLSNLMLIDPKTDRPTRIGFKVLDGGNKVRVARTTGNVIEG
jgi:large subunit ribosomal protein L24